MTSDRDDVALQARIDELVARLDALQRGIHEFIALWAHELRTPLGAILMWAHVLRTGRPSDREMALDAIEASARAQSELIGGLLDLSRALVGRLRIDRLPVDLVKAVRLVVDELHPMVAEAQAHMNLSVAGSCRVSGDVRRLHDIVSSLVKNAIQATPVGGTIEVEVTESDSAIGVAVHHPGPGLSVDELAEVFTPFRPAGGRGVPHPGVLGIELPLARLLAELHGGTMSAASGGEGQGCTYTLKIPRNQPLDAPVGHKTSGRDQAV
jgi:signal transduction histidine kinase